MFIFCFSFFFKFIHKYGWDVLEGYDCFEAETCDSAGMTQPVYIYNHTTETSYSIIGGQVYRGGAAESSLLGKYIFGDFVSGYNFGRWIWEIIRWRNLILESILLMEEG